MGRGKRRGGGGEVGLQLDSGGGEEIEHMRQGGREKEAG